MGRGGRGLGRRRAGGRTAPAPGPRRDPGSDPAPTWTGIAAAVIAAARNVDIAVNVCGVDVGAVNVGGVDATVARGNAGPVAASGGSTAIGPACVTAARSSGIPAAGTRPTAGARPAAPATTAAALRQHYRCIAAFRGRGCGSASVPIAPEGGTGGYRRSDEPDQGDRHDIEQAICHHYGLRVVSSRLLGHPYQSRTRPLNRSNSAPV